MDKYYASVDIKFCPICGKQHEVGVLLDRKLRKSLEWNTVTGWEICPDCKAHLDNGYIALIGIDVSKSDLENNKITLKGAYRTGNLAFLKKETFLKIFTTDSEEYKNGFIFCDDELILKMQSHAH